MRMRRDRFGDERIREVIEAAREAKRPVARLTYWNHAAFLATRYPGWSSGRDSQGRQRIYRLTRQGARGAVYGQRVFVTRTDGREEVMFRAPHRWAGENPWRDTR